MLVAAAVCPHPPLLIPELASDVATELDGLRAACDDAVAALADDSPDEVVVLGADPAGVGYPPTAGASMRPYGVDVRVGGPNGELPLALAVGAWLLGRAGNRWPVRYLGLPPDAASSDCLALGRALSAQPVRTALLVMGDGSARRTPRSPGRYDERAEPFDQAVADALAAGDVAALAALEPAMSKELMVAGRAAWQALAGAAEPVLRSGGSIAPLLRFASAPYGVGYLVASWRMHFAPVSEVGGTA